MNINCCNGSLVSFQAAYRRKVIVRLKKTWTKLTDDDIAMYYMQGTHGTLSSALGEKYNYTPEQAEDALSTIERLAEKD